MYILFTSCQTGHYAKKNHLGTYACLSGLIAGSKLLNLRVYLEIPSLFACSTMPELSPVFESDIGVVRTNCPLTYVLRNLAPAPTELKTLLVRSSEGITRSLLQDLNLSVARKRYYAACITKGIGWMTARVYLPR
jgi:hypothetical protein